MLKNAYFLAKIGVDTAENEQHFAEILPIGRPVADRPGPVGLTRKISHGAVGIRNVLLLQYPEEGPTDRSLFGKVGSRRSF